MQHDIIINPIGKPRMTQRDKWQKRPCVMRYRHFCDELRSHVGTDEIPTQLKMVFEIPMPKSWSKKKMLAHDGQPHDQKPDIDNLVKAVMDALLKDDSKVWKIDAEKVWAIHGRIKLREAENAENKSY